jgi:hypothetical protein
MKCYNLFLDDIRTPDVAYIYKKEPSYIKESWIVVKNYSEFVQTISEKYAEGYVPCALSLDHDLTPEHYKIGVIHAFYKFDESSVTEPTGWHCLRWFLKFCKTQDLALPKIILHSQNPAGRINMSALIDEYKKENYGM